jgi:hypothetical protein
MNIISNLEICPGVEDILRGQGVDPEVTQKRKPLLRLVAERALTEGTNLIHPVALTSEVIVQAHRHERILLEGGWMLTSPQVTRQLAGAQRVVAAVCTIGPDIEDAVSRLMGEDPLYALALDGLANAAVEILVQEICSQIGEQVQDDKMQASTPLSPGSPEWPVEIGQPQILSLLDPFQAGITLTSGGMMIPKKSMSFIVGIGAEMSHANMCEVCSLKETCRYGHA